MDCMNVIKRDGTKEEVSFDKVLRRIKNLSNGLNINTTVISQKICSQIHNDIKTSVMDELGAEECASLSTEHPDYGILSSRLIVSNHHKNTTPSFSECIHMLYFNYDIHHKHCPLITKELYDIVNIHKAKLNDVIDSSRDFNIDFFGFKTLERAYLLKINNKVIERPQFMFMRVALGIHKNDIKEAIQTYNYMSNGLFIHATPTLFNAGTPRPQLSSCFLLPMQEDSIAGIYDTLKSCALISQSAGGIGLWIHNVRGKEVQSSTNSISNGSYQC